MERLTEKQERVMDFIVEHIDERGYPPTMREIGSRFGFNFPAARGHLRALERKGMIRLVPGRSRGIEVIGMRPPKALSLPLVGNIRAGRPIIAREEVEAHISVDPELFHDRDAFVLRVTGESMRDAGIRDGDYVVISPGAEVRDRDIGAALIGDEATVKQIEREAGDVLLVPCNPEFTTLRLPEHEVRILGKVIGLVRKF
jgi:repressor LexA